MKQHKSPALRVAAFALRTDFQALALEVPFALSLPLQSTKYAGPFGAAMIGAVSEMRMLGGSDESTFGSDDEQASSVASAVNARAMAGR